jgi:hypothetical protein
VEGNIGNATHTQAILPILQYVIRAAGALYSALSLLLLRLLLLACCAPATAVCAPFFLCRFIDLLRCALLLLFAACRRHTQPCCLGRRGLLLATMRTAEPDRKRVRKEAEDEGAGTAPASSATTAAPAASSSTAAATAAGPRHGEPALAWLLGDEARGCTSASSPLTSS